MLKYSVDRYFATQQELDEVMQEMTRVKVGEHLIVNVNRRSLCDNCAVESCVAVQSGRVLECKRFKAPFIALVKCKSCGHMFDIFSNLNALDYELCPVCGELQR
ncbi:MAG: hypothetical protein LUO84_04970 [Methanomassiliicoccales archaeon]|nr:hypothetical protein [Methanomassiliicoccales archaeon]